MVLKKSISIALLFGGPSPERGISLNSARSVCDHLQSAAIEIVPVYFDTQKRAYAVSRNNLYSNTPSDFDFKLKEWNCELHAAGLERLIKSTDFAFPVIHGAFGEDGEIQQYLSSISVPAIGSDADACRACFDKYIANERIRAEGFFAPPSLLLETSQIGGWTSKIANFFAEQQLTRAVVKPSTGGSSIGVFSVSTPEQALATAHKLVKDGFYSRLVIEPFCVGKEFTAVIIESRTGAPVCLLPLEIEADYANHQILDFRKKYLPTRQVVYHCPPRFGDPTIKQIQQTAEKLFAMFGMSDFARFDGWVLPDGNIWFSDFNPVSGMEQNSFLFIEAARVGLSHRSILLHIVENRARKLGIELDLTRELVGDQRTAINVLFGGSTSERQVSVMSGTNVWLKLRQSTRYSPKPFFLASDGAVWEIPYALALNHTAEDIEVMCNEAKKNFARDERLRSEVLNKIACRTEIEIEPSFIPQKFTLDQFLDHSKIVFIGLHGGIGENGELARLCDSKGVAYNGSSPQASELCMDKYLLGETISKMKDPDLATVPKKQLILSALERLSKEQRAELWRKLCGDLKGPPLILKPNGDGCSSGVALIVNAEEFLIYFDHIMRSEPRIPAGLLSRQSSPVELPSSPPPLLLAEYFVESDHLKIVGHEIQWMTKSGWVEVTIGVFEQDGRLRALNPSITVASESVLSVEEKFQGGTGINITPPPSQFVKPACIARTKGAAEKLAESAGIRGYCRIDAFMNVRDGALMVIEINSLPALTPSTVIFQQALAEDPPIPPREFLEILLDSATRDSR